MLESRYQIARLYTDIHSVLSKNSKYAFRRGVAALHCDRLFLSCGIV
jgi:hypothetical protein